VVIGVTPAAFSGVLLDSPQDIWVPAAMEPLVRQPSARSSGAMGVGLIGRLRPGVSLHRALAEMTVLNRWRVEETARASHDPLWRQATIELVPASAGVSPAREYVGGPLLALMATVALLLVLSCANVAGMLLARAAGRHREIAVRVSLGAGRARLLRLVLIESLMLSGLASILGLAIAWAGSAALVRIVASGRPLPGMGPLLLRPSLDAHVLLFTAVTAVTTALLFGVAPAWHAFSVAPMSSLREASVVGESRPRRRFAKALVVAQVALSIVVLSLAALFLRHLSALRNVDVGFDRKSVLLVGLDPARSGLQGRQLANAFEDLVSRFATMPGVRAVTVAAVTPIQGGAASRFVKVEGFEEPPDHRRRVALNWIGSGYFATFGTPIVAGRDFGPADAGGPRAALVNEAMVRHYFGGRDPIGGRFAFEGQDDPYTIVGVVADAKYSDLHEPAPRTVYLSAFQDGRVMPRHLALRTSVSPLALAPDVRRIVQDSVKGIRIEKVTTLSDQVDASIVPERLLAMLASVFAAAAALLAAIGVYGLLAYSVARRVSEIGLRRALGATEWDIVRMVLGSALGLVAAGVLVGAPLAFWGRRLTLALVGDLPRGVIGQTLAAASVMLIVALLAAYVPARRAARVNPADALRRS
jgi:predicted permease